MTVTEPDPTPDPGSQPSDSGDPNSITIPAPPEAPTPPPRTQRGSDPQSFTQEDIDRIRQEERARVAAEQQRADALDAELAKYRQSDEERQKAEVKAQRDAERAQKKKEEEEMELRDLMTRRDAEWEEKLNAERAEREKALAILEQERRHAHLQTYLAGRMASEAEEIMPELRDMVSGNSEQEIDASIELAKNKSQAIMGQFNMNMQQQRAQGRTASVTSPPVGPPEMAGGTTRSYNADDLKALTAEEYAAIREDLHRAASAQYRNR